MLPFANTESKPGRRFCGTCSGRRPCRPARRPVATTTDLKDVRSNLRDGPLSALCSKYGPSFPNRVGNCNTHINLRHLRFALARKLSKNSHLPFCRGTGAVGWNEVYPFPPCRLTVLAAPLDGLRTSACPLLNSCHGPCARSAESSRIGLSGFRGCARLLGDGLTRSLPLFRVRGLSLPWKGMLGVILSGPTSLGFREKPLLDDVQEIAGTLISLVTPCRDFPLDPYPQLVEEHLLSASVPAQSSYSSALVSGQIFRWDRHPACHLCRTRSSPGVSSCLHRDARVRVS